MIHGSSRRILQFIAASFDVWGYRNRFLRSIMNVIQHLLNHSSQKKNMKPPLKFSLSMTINKALLCCVSPSLRTPSASRTAPHQHSTRLQRGYEGSNTCLSHSTHAEKRRRQIIRTAYQETQIRGPCVPTSARHRLGVTPLQKHQLGHGEIQDQK